VLHTFKGAPGDGEGPFGGLTLDPAGNIYGTATSGGTGKCSAGCGTGFRLNGAGKELQLSFGGGDGRDPMAGLLRDAEGNFYGTTSEGGDTNCLPPYGCGTVFKVSKAGKETVLHKFAGAPDGLLPESQLVEDAEGNLYGTTPNGGTGDNGGTVFKIDHKGNETILYNFCSQPNCVDGSLPYSGVILDAAGNLYGTTDDGGAYCCGIVYKIDPLGNETVLYSFTGSSDGDGPLSALAVDRAGNLYGTTKAGGNSGCTEGAGCGVVFELSPVAGGAWTEKVLYVFCSLSDCADGEEPVAGPLILDAEGNLYGTTFDGGDENGDGVVFKLDGAGRETVLHTFSGGADGAFPWSGLTIDGAGNLYGTATGGGDDSCFAPSGCGVVYKITP